MPTFCRHNRLIQNCPICSREQEIELRPVVSSSQPRTSLPRTPSRSGTGSTRSRRGSSSATAGGLRVRRGAFAPVVRQQRLTERLAQLFCASQVGRRGPRVGVDQPMLGQPGAEARGVRKPLYPGLAIHRVHEEAYLLEPTGSLLTFAHNQ